MSEKKNGGKRVKDEKTRRKQVEENANEDLELKDEAAAKVGGGEYPTETVSLNYGKIEWKY